MMLSQFDPERAVGYFRDFFPNDWLSKVSWAETGKTKIDPSHLKSEVPKEVGLILNQMINFTGKLYEYFSCLYLSGYYTAISIDTSKLIVEKFEKMILSHSVGIADYKESGDYQEVFNQHFFTQVINPFLYHIKPEFLVFSKDLDAQYDLIQSISVEKWSKRFDSDSLDTSLQDWAFFYDIVIRTLRVEHFNFSLTKNCLTDLHLARKQVQELNIDENMKKALEAKVLFLLKKLAYRIEIDENRFGSDLVFAFGLEESILNVEKISNEDQSFFSNWDNVISIHYGLHKNFKDEQRNSNSQIYFEVPRENYIVQHFHSLVKSYKDDTKSKEQIDNLLQHFKLNFGQSQWIDKFKLYLYKITYSYIFNNRVSIISEVCSSFDQLAELESDVRSLQTKDLIKNYFPWKKLCESVCRNLDILSQDLIEGSSFKDFCRLKDKFHIYIRKYEECFDWTNRKRLLPLQLSFSECQSAYTIETTSFGDFPLFFHSGYLIPIDYVKEKRILDDFKAKKVKYDHLYEVFERVSDLVIKVKETAADVQNQEKRSIEILGIFSAVALFSVGSISTFVSSSNLSTNDNIFKFILTFGHILFLFVMGIWFITRENVAKISKGHWLVLAAITLSSLLLLTYFGFWPSFT